MAPELSREQAEPTKAPAQSQAAPATAVAGTPVSAVTGLGELVEQIGNSRAVALMTAGVDPSRVLELLVVREDLAALLTFHAAQIRRGLKHVVGNDDLVLRGHEWVDYARDFSDFLSEQPQAAIAADQRDVARELFAERDAIRKEIDGHARHIARGTARMQVHRAALSAARLANELRRLEPALADMARAAFKAGDQTLLESIGGLVGSVSGTAGKVQEMAETIPERLRPDILDPELIGKYAEGLGKLNDGLSKINVALALVDAKGASQFDKGLNQFMAGAEIFGMVAGKLPPPLNMWAESYLLPLTTSCIGGFQRISEFRHEQNTQAITAGMEGWADFRYELGGKPVWDYMLTVMRARDELQVPTPSGTVADYFVVHRHAFSAGVKGAGRSPFLHGELRTHVFRGWVFVYRRQVWALLYGSRPVP